MAKPKLKNSERGGWVHKNAATTGRIGDIWKKTLESMGSESDLLAEDKWNILSFSIVWKCGSIDVFSVGI